MNPLALPVLTSPGQPRHATFAYARGQAAGYKYNDPLTSVSVLKLTDATTPTTNSGVGVGYPSHRWSLPWVGGDGKTYYTLGLDNVGYFVDIDYEAHTAVNYRSSNGATGPGDTGFAFSQNPATPRICYYIDGAVIRRYNTATNALENATGFPFTNPDGSNLTWIQTQIDDTWLCWVRNAGPSGAYYGYKPSTGTLRTMTIARATPATDFDECHLDLRDPIIYMVTGLDTAANAPWNLDTDTFDMTPGTQTSQGPMTAAHTSCGPGFIVGVAHWESGGGAFLYEGLANVIDHIIVGADNYHSDGSDYYTSCHWYKDLPGGSTDAIADGWHMTAREFQDYPTGKVRRYAICLFKNDGSDGRLVCHHDSAGDGADTYPRWAKPFLTYDGKLLAFTSDMNNNVGRWDSFCVKLPTIAA